MTKIKFEATYNKFGCFIYTDLKTVKKEQIDEIKNLINNYGVLFFKNKNLSPSEYINFSSNFGVPAKYPMLRPHNDFKDIYMPATEENLQNIANKIDDVATGNLYKNKAKQFITKYRSK